MNRLSFPQEVDQPLGLIKILFKVAHPFAALQRNKGFTAGTPQIVFYNILIPTLEQISHRFGSGSASAPQRLSRTGRGTRISTGAHS